MQFRGGMNELMRQAARMQRKIDQAKSELKDRELTVEGLGGKVKVVVTLGHSVKRIEIDKDTSGQRKNTDLVARTASDRCKQQALEQADQPEMDCGAQERSFGGDQDPNGMV